MSDPESEITEDFFLDGKLRLRQPKRGHRAGHDAILLAAATPAQPGDRVADFGAGVGAAGLAVAIRVPTIDCVLVEIDSVVAELARANARLNSVKADVHVLDVTASVDVFAAAGLAPDSLDVVLMNPPFNNESRHQSSPHTGRQIAHVAREDTLDRWIHAARRMLKSGGTLTMIWRAEGLGEILAGLDRGFGSIGILPVHPDAAKTAIRVIVTAIKGGRAPMTICRGLMLNDVGGSASAEARAILGGQSISSLRKDSQSH
jgi:tRNA1(Val) A37 N6-methylase TrmN6